MYYICFIGEPHGTIVYRRERRANLALEARLKGDLNEAAAQSTA
jgi:hypothetical protein